jgi:4'-phosphopantetheinyl transferase
VIGPGEIHIWRAPLDRVDSVETLDDLERERAARFRFEEHRKRFIAAHVALRRILSRYHQPVRFATGEFGKPHLIDSPVRFSMSHSGDLGLYAVALETEVGIDVERVSERADAVSLALRFFPPEEAAAVAADPACFLRIWTRREAYLKALGIGIRGIRSPIPAGFFVADLDAGPGYAAAVACERNGMKVIEAVS